MYLGDDSMDVMELRCSKCKSSNGSHEVRGKHLLSGGGVADLDDDSTGVIELRCSKYKSSNGSHEVRGKHRHSTENMYFVYILSNVSLLITTL